MTPLNIFFVGMTVGMATSGLIWSVINEKPLQAIAWLAWGAIWFSSVLEHL